MKNRVFLILLFISLGVFAQEEESKKNSFYLNGGLGIGNYTSLDIGLNFVIKNNISLYWSNISGIRSSKEKPRDYEKGFFEFFGPTDHIITKVYGIGKIIKVDKLFDIGDNDAHLNFIVGIAKTRLIRKVNFRNKIEYIHTSLETFHTEPIKGAYDYDKEKISLLSVFINPRFELYLFKAFGVSLNPLFILNKKSSYYGLGIGFLLGKLR